MLFDWSAACSADDPVLVVPWHDVTSGLHFIDLRDDPDALDSIAEAEQFPALLQCLRALNGARSPLFTAKCDVWPASAEELAAIALELQAEPEHAVAGQISYLDLLCRDRALFSSFHQQQHLLGRMERRLAALEQPAAIAEAVVRPALMDFTSPQEGFCLSLYIKAVGSTSAAADQAWSGALVAVTSVLRSRELFPQT